MVNLSEGNKIYNYGGYEKKPFITPTEPGTIPYEVPEKEEPTNPEKEPQVDPFLVPKKEPAIEPVKD